MNSISETKKTYDELIFLLVAEGQATSFGKVLLA